MNRVFHIPSFRLAGLLRGTALLSLLAMAGCATMNREMPQPGDPFWAPVPPQVQAAPATPTGSIFANARSNGLFEDRLAHQVGDLLTVTLQEKTQSKKSAGSKFAKESGVEFNEASILGTAISAKNLSLLTDPEFKRDFKGDADADQSNSLQGSISVTVAEVLPNGVLRIRGEKWMTLNQGDEFIRLTGLVRPQDIGIDNTIPSTKIADARIAYSGTGEFASATRQGWLSQFFNSEWWPL